MDRRRALAYARDAVAYPAGALCVAAGVGWAAGVGPGLGVLGASTLAAAALTASYLGDDRGTTGTETTERRTGPEIRAALSEGTPDPGAGRRARLRTFAAGLFVESVAVVLWLGGAFG